MKKWKCTVCNQIFEGERPPVPCPVCGAGEEAFVEVNDAPTNGEFHRDTDDQFVIIGGGIAAVSAAKAIRKRNSTASVTIVGAEEYLPYQRPALKYVMETRRSPEEMALEKKEFYEQNNITLLTGVKGEAINFSDKTVTLSNEESLPFTKLLLATGSNPFNPIKSEYSSIPVRVLRDYNDAIFLADEAKGKKIVVVGGGILGLEAAYSLHAIGASVTVVEMAPRILPLQTDLVASEMLHDKLADIGIDLITGDSVVNTTATGVVLGGGVEMDADMVLASLGVRSETSLAVALGLDLSRGILVDEFMRTSHDNVWAAGDCAEYGGALQARAGAATAMGTTAGASMAGDDSKPYKPYIPATIYSVEDYSLFSVGKIDEDAKQEARYRDDNKKAYKRLFFEDGQLSGGVFVGGHPGFKAEQAIRDKMSVNEALSMLQVKP